MIESILLVRGRALMPVPRAEWEKHVHLAPAQHVARQTFMTPDHHRVRYYVVRALAAVGHPVAVRLQHVHRAEGVVRVDNRQRIATDKWVAWMAAWQSGHALTAGPDIALPSVAIRLAV